MAKIVVPVDFSTTSDKALEFAFSLARRLDASLHIVHIAHLPMLDAAGPMGYAADAYREMREKAVKATDERMNKYKDRGVDIQAEIRDGFVAEEIVRYVNEMMPDYVVMGTTGASGLIASVIGTNAAFVIRKAKVPVILIPENWEPGPLKDIIYAAMLEDSELKYLKQAIHFASIYDAHLSILKVDASLQLNQTDDQILLNELRAELGDKTPALLQINADSPSEGIEDFIEYHPVDLVVLVARRLSIFDRIFEASTTRRMAMHSKVPLLVLHRD